MAKTSKTYEFGPPATPGPWHVVLHSTEGGSDKIYEISLEPVGDDLFTVSYANGRRGGTMASGTKAVEVGYAQAKAAAEDVLHQKVKKGYNPVDSLSGHFQPGTGGPIRPEDSGVRLKSLLPVDALEDVQTLLDNPSFVAQEKYDGQRRAVVHRAGSVMRRTGGGDPALFGVNRRGMMVTLPTTLTQTLRTDIDYVIDAELVGDRLHVFDALEIDGNDLRAEPYRERLRILRMFAQNMVAAGAPIEVVKTATTAQEKREMLQAVRGRGGEGLVFKHQEAPYAQERDQAQIKVKFWNTLSAIAAPGRDGRNSIGLELIDEDGGRLPVGNVTVPANQTMPEPGQVVEIRYLYAYPQGSLYTPTLLGIRDDVAPEECASSQRAFKPAESAVDMTADSNPTDSMPAPGA